MGRLYSIAWLSIGLLFPFPNSLHHATPFVRHISDPIGLTRRDEHMRFPSIDVPV